MVKLEHFKGMSTQGISRVLGQNVIEANPTPSVVSVVVPTFNRRDFIGAAVANALNQSYRSTQVIVADDGSSDDTSEVVARFPSVRYLMQTNQGPSAARNLALGKATGEFIAFLDSDDEWDLNHLDDAVATLSSNPTVGMVVSNWREIDGKGEVTNANAFGKRSWFTAESQCGDAQVLLPHAAARRWFLQCSPAPPTAVVLRREVIGCSWNPRIRVGEDRLFFLLNLIHSRCDIAVHLAPSWSFRCHGGNAYQSHHRTDLLAYRDNLCLREIERSIHDLRVEEKRLLNRATARNYRDWGYYASTHDAPIRARILLCQALKLSPSLKTFKMYLGNCCRRKLKE